MKRILLILSSLVILNDTISQKCLAFIYPVDSQQICTNKLITLRATGHSPHSQNKNQNGATTDKEPTNTVSYLWSTGETSANINIQKPGTYTVTIFNSITGCKSNATFTNHSNSTSNTITGDSTVCRGNTLQFSTTGTGGTWKSSNISAVGTIHQNGLFTTGTSAGTTKIMYIVKNTNGCGDTASKWITILQKPTAGTIAGAASVCMSGTIQFTTTGTGGTWSSSNISDVGTINQNGLFSTGTRAGTTKIMYIVTNANGCSDTASKWITIYYRPNAGNITGDSTVCRGNTLQFSTTGTGGTWKSSNISAVGTIHQNGLFTTGTSAGTTKIMYIVKNTNGCGDTASKWITILQKPTAGTIAGAASVCMSGTIQLTASVHGGAWSSSDTSIASVGSNGLVTGKSPGNVEIRYTVTSSTNNCTNTISKMMTVTPQSFTRESQGNQIANRSITNSDVLLAPNPSNNQFRLVIHSADNKTSIRVFDINGKTFYSTTTTGNQTITFGETLAPGIYIVEIRQGSDVKIIKAVKIK